jgi:hypothetical protein
MSLPQASLDLNQRFHANQAFSGAGPGRGRGRDSGSRNRRDSRFTSVDIASQMVQQGYIPPNLYNGRGLPNVSNAQNASWNAFGLITRIPTGGMDTLHSIGLQGPLGPPINSSMNMGIPCQRCRDFEEHGCWGTCAPWSMVSIGLLLKMFRYVYLICPVAEPQDINSSLLATQNALLIWQLKSTGISS